MSGVVINLYDLVDLTVYYLYNLSNFYVPKSLSIHILQVSAEWRTEKDVIMYRAYLAQRKFGVILDGVGSGAPSELQAVRMYADYMSSDSGRR